MNLVNVRKSRSCTANVKTNFPDLSIEMFFFFVVVLFWGLFLFGFLPPLRPGFLLLLCFIQSGSHSPRIMT